MLLLYVISSDKAGLTVVVVLPSETKYQVRNSRYQVGNVGMVEEHCISTSFFPIRYRKTNKNDLVMPPRRPSLSDEKQKNSRLELQIFKNSIRHDCETQRWRNTRY